jgi:DNA-binding FadR family transcriptional regulator
MAEIIEISRLALHDQVAARLRTWLVEGAYRPAPSSTSARCASSCASRARRCAKAIKLLAADGLVDLLPNRGAVVVRLGEPMCCRPSR